MLPLRIIYDGECPFCSRYVRLVRLRENFRVELIDARQAPEDAKQYGHDLDKGMIVDIGGRVHHGADAVWMLSQLSTRSGLWNRILAAVFAWRPVAHVLYPIMRLGRRITLLLLGRRPL